jgi:hypothetical protein
VGNSNKLGLYWPITSYFEAFFLKERMNISDNLHELRISHRIFLAIINRTSAFLKFKIAARHRNTFSTLVLKIGTTFLTAALRKTEATPRSADQLPQ